MESLWVNYAYHVNYGLVNVMLYFTHRPPQDFSECLSKLPCFDMPTCLQTSSRQQLHFLLWSRPDIMHRPLPWIHVITRLLFKFRLKNPFKADKIRCLYAQLNKIIDDQQICLNLKNNDKTKPFRKDRTQKYHTHLKKK